ncbi:MAG: Flp pilus assembly complex ATPase component TadA [Planctomycetes bacterium]|nr:Flp pilus assembly complex ATPase component TadA [Planctomycetota bacterium]
MKTVQDISNTPTIRTELLFGELLASKGLLTREELNSALTEQNDHGGRLGEVLHRLKLLDEEDVTCALAEHLSMEYIRLDDATTIDTNIARLVPESIAKRFCLVALRENESEADKKVIVAMADPLNVIAIDTVTLKMKRQIEIVISSPKEIRQTIEKAYHGCDIEEQSLRDLVKLEAKDELPNDSSGRDAVQNMDSQAAATQAPVVRFVSLMLSHAAKSRASDIHVEPQEYSMLIRMRIDGTLREMVPPARNMQAAVVTRLKILSDMNIAEHRLPQDGRFKIKNSHGKDIDIRVSAIPTIYGEKIVMRILDASSAGHDLNKVGFEPEFLEEFKDALSQPHGIIVVTGPTGSGKSTTLYSALNYLKDPAKNITTVEDPVEYRLAGINQIQVKPEINLDFASCLRAILRQDPDIVLIGEIRDKETVEIAIKASLTGHLVLSTFHTNDAPSAISRFVYMGIDPCLLASSLNMVVAQRLVRKICEHCKEPVTISEEILKRLKISPEQAKDAVFYKGRGCKACGQTGYHGRLPIFEVLTLDNQMRQELIEGAGEARIRQLSQQNGNGGLLQSGANKVLQGLTTAEEILKTAFTESTRKRNVN